MTESSKSAPVLGNQPHRGIIAIVKSTSKDGAVLNQIYSIKYARPPLYLNIKCLGIGL